MVSHKGSGEEWTHAVCHLSPPRRSVICAKDGGQGLGSNSERLNFEILTVQGSILMSWSLVDCVTPSKKIGVSEFHCSLSMKWGLR